MAAPALILLAEGSNDLHVATSYHAIRRRLQMMRPNLEISLAFLDHCPPSGPQVVTSLANRGVTEIVFVPLSLTAAVSGGHRAAAMLARVRAAHPGIAFSVSRPVGPSVELLNLIDEHLRAALRAARALELDALVLATPGDTDTRGAALLARRARQWSGHHRLPCAVATNDATGPNTAAAISSLRAQGRRHIAVGSMYLVRDDNYQAQAQAAASAGAVAVSAPLGQDERVLELALARYSFAAMELLDAVELADAAPSSLAL